MNRLTKLRFDALAGYCRQPRAILAGEELEWYEAAGERMLGFVLRDRSDGDFTGMVLAPDERLRYRWIDSTTEWFQAPADARRALEAKLREIEPRLEQARLQGDSKKAAVDFFNVRVKADRLHPAFVALKDSEGYSPARGIIEPMMRWHEDLDGNFIEQFQTTGFDARIFELYLFATFVEAGCAIGKDSPVPDFTCTSLFGSFAVEATTVNPSLDAKGEVIAPPVIESDTDLNRFQRQYMPIKFAGPLIAKLRKQYWKNEEVKGKPLLIAIEDFHAPGSMTYSRAGLPIYLYGNDHIPKYDADGTLRIEVVPVKEHVWGSKVVPSGFFNLPEAENISAVLFTNAGTISKFNRMGLLAGFGSKNVELVREGYAMTLDPNATEPTAFSKRVNDADYEETWVESVDVFHNPRALHPFDPKMLPGATHHRSLPDGQVESMGPRWCPLWSTTAVVVKGDYLSPPAVH